MNQDPIYKPISGFPGYRVGDDGSVWRAWVTCRSGRKLTAKWRPMKLSPSTRGYLRVNLTPPEGGRYRTLRVNRLVLEAFVGPCPEGMECRHRDGNKLNNRLANLVWGTHEENQDDIAAHGTRPVGESHPMRTLTESDVLAIRERYAAGTPQKVLANDFNTSVPNISTIVNRKSWAHI